MSVESIAATVICAISLPGTAHGAEHEGLLLARENIDVPEFDSISDRPLIHLYASEADYSRARSDDRFRYERLTYRSDELAVIALLYRPLKHDGPMPTIVFNRGSYVRNDAAPEYLTAFHRLAESGYAVLAPMYRGSEGAEGEDEMGGADLNDLMQIGALADELPVVDARRLYLLGESRGGMMVLQAIRDDFPASAAAIYGNPTDFYDLLEQFPEQYRSVADRLWPGWQADTDSILGRRSAVRWADRIDIPLLILHGGADRSMPVSQSLALASRLQDLGKTYELHVFGYENHAISGRAGERDALVMAWFAMHAADQAAEDPASE